MVLNLSLLLVAPMAAQADAGFGDGGYSNCGYASNCSTPTPVNSSQPLAAKSPAPGAASPTLPVQAASRAPAQVVETASGLSFAVNLSDGQIIPLAGYTVSVTPLNGQGKTASRVEFYIDGHLQGTVSPSPSGTFYWRWDPTRYPGADVKIVIGTMDGLDTTQQFHVKLQAQSSAVVSGTNPITDLGRAVKHLAKQIPVPLAYGFPYLLFLIMGAMLLLLVLQVRREVAKAKALAVVLVAKHSIAESKATFIQLASHYLRTPVTVMSGGVDVQSATGSVPQRVLEPIQQEIKLLQVQVEGLLRGLMSAIDESSQTPVSDPKLAIKAWLQPSFIVPFLLIGGLVLSFNFLAIHIGEIDVALINLLVQIVLYASLSIGLYMVIRSRVLRRRERAQTQQLIDEQVSLDQARNKLIRDAAGSLRASLAHIRSLIPLLGSGQGVNILTDGVLRLEKLLGRFETASLLEAGHAQEPLENYSLSTLLNRALQSSASAALAKQLKLNLPEHAQLTSRNPEWAEIVLSSLVDNAVAYSPTGGAVTILARGGLRSTTITISDQGQGIPPDKLPHVFEPFSRSDGALVFNHEGMGFSLYLDKLIMEYIGGNIRLTSEPRKGTRVTLEFPCV